MNKLLGGEDGTTPVELAFALPILMVLTVGTVEVGRAMYQAGAIERGIRAGAIYAAHRPSPLTTATIDEVKNIVKTGQPQSGGSYLLEGWSHASASVDVQPSSYNLSGTSVEVVRVTANVPFDPILPGFFTAFFDAGTFTFNLSHEQAHVGE